MGRGGKGEEEGREGKERREEGKGREGEETAPPFTNSWIRP